VEPGFPAKAVDATGAGDCFTAGVLSSYIRGGLKPPSACGLLEFVRFANAAASVCVEKMGGIPSMPTMEQVRERLAMR
jgi:sugar/nucleoside kinase (ribokinase family)